MNTPQAMRHYLEENLASYLELLRQMVAINSFSTNPGGVDALGSLTASAFAQLDFVAERIPATNPGFGSHLVLTRAGKSPRTIALISHLDTVFTPQEEEANNFFWRRAGDRIHGPGTVDIKGGTVVIYMMLDALRRHAPTAFDEITWMVMLDAAEEAEMLDFGQLCRRRLNRDTLACLVFEGGGLAAKEFSLVTARKGMAIYRLTVVGKGAHAGGSHSDGANAIVQMADVIQRIAGFTDYGRHLTFNVGTIAGGTVVNRVPHLVTALVEMRAFSPVVFEEGLARMISLNDLVTVRSVNGDYPCRVTVELIRRMAPWSRNVATDRLLAIWQDAAQDIGMRAVAEERGGLSDGNLLWDLAPTLDGLGPSGGNMHCSESSQDGAKEQEYVLLTSMVPKALMNATAVLKLIEEGLLSA